MLTPNHKIIRDMLESNPYERPTKWPSYPAEGYVELERQLRQIAKLDPTSEHLDFLEALVRGDCDSGPYKFPAVFRWDSTFTTYTAYEPALIATFPSLMKILADNHRLEKDLLRQAMLRVPGLSSIIWHGAEGTLAAKGPFYRGPDITFFKTLFRWTQEIAAEFLEDLSNPAHREVLSEMYHFEGWRFALAAARVSLNTRDYEPPPAHRFWRIKKPAHVIRHVLQYTRAGSTSEADRAALVQGLSQLPEKTLKEFMPLVPAFCREFLKALGWEAATPLVDDLARISVSDPYFGVAHGDVRNSPEPTLGRFDAAQAKAALDAVPTPLAKEVLAAFRRAKVAENSVMLYEAMLGENRAQIEKSILKRKQPAIKAYGFLPLERGLDETLERYLFLKQFAKESRKFGAMRQANERAAVQVALDALAQMAGFSDADRLEWEMEARLAGDTIAPGRAWRIDDYTLTLTLSDMDGSIQAERGGKPLKTIPKSVRDSEAYAEIKDAVTQARAQIRRFRAMFEEMMASGGELSTADLGNLGRMPLATDLLRRLILLADDSALGLYQPETQSVQTLDGSVQPIRQRALIAHPFHLFQFEELASWQREIVKQRVVQPFKQAFRELYLLTPAERETRFFSNRFAGHVVNGAVAGRLLTARGWQVEPGDTPLPFKVFREAGLQAVFSFPDAMHYLSSMPTITSDRIAFARYPGPLPWPAGDRTEGMLPLEDAPPLIFSEVMRDADLIVSVAQSEGEDRLSREAYERRAEIIAALLDDLGLPQVRVDGNFAHVPGKLANYRVHLGSAVIHIEPGNYLCIVPDRWGKPREKLYLPFADAGDDKISEVISKILLLLRDDKIKDESILRQIRARAGMRG